MSDLHAWLDGIEPEELAERFAGVDAEEIARLIAETPDRELRALIDQDPIREAALDAGFGRFAEFAVPERLAEVSGIVRFVVRRGKGLDGSYDAAFADGSVAVDPSGPDEPDLTITTDAITFLRLLSGTASAALLVLAGDIRVVGDEALAIQVGGVFRVPGSQGVAVDPTALDAVEVAGVISRTKDAHLREIMSGGFRPVVLGEIFRRFPEYLDEKRSAKLRVAACFKIGGGPAEDDRYLVEIDRGACTVTPAGEGGDRSRSPWVARSSSSSRPATSIRRSPS